MDDAGLVTLSGIWKSYGGVPVLRSVDLALARGEIHALVGGNGAGKSTLMKILAGVIAPDGGTITVRGSSHSRLTPALAHRIGISLVPQEPQLFPHMSVAENLSIALGRRVATDDVVQTFESLGHRIQPNRAAGTLSIADQQLVEIAKGVLRNAEVLVVDEPTAALTDREVDHLFERLRGLVQRGFGIFYISHRLHEIAAICTRVSVLRDGAIVFEGPARMTSPLQLVEYMIPDAGSRGSDMARQRVIATETPVLEVLNLSGPGFEAVSFDVRPGQITALAGPVGSGRTEVAEAILGIRPSTGRVRVGGEDYANRTPARGLQRGIALLPEDRQAHGVFLGARVTENITASILHQLARFRVPRRKETEIATTWAKELSLTGATVMDAAGRLSGGNQQKVAFARSLAPRPRVVILDEPSRGVDVGARADLYRSITDLAARQVGILLISSDLEEVVHLADRVLIMHGGRIITTLEGADVTFAAIRAAAFTGAA